MKCKFDRMVKGLFGAISLGLVACSSAQSADHACALTYETFEIAIPHIDAEKCPDMTFNDKAFCRISVGSDQAHVFYFSNKDKQCLLKVESYDDEEMSFEIKQR